jgi:hypothetical protein
MDLRDGNGKLFVTRIEPHLKARQMYGCHKVVKIEMDILDGFAKIHIVVLGLIITMAIRETHRLII